MKFNSIHRINYYRLNYGWNKKLIWIYKLTKYNGRTIFPLLQENILPNEMFFSVVP